MTEVDAGLPKGSSGHAKIRETSDLVRSFRGVTDGNVADTVFATRCSGSGA
jgi:hypothetical protein